MNDFVKEAEKNCVNVAKNMSDMLNVIKALERFGSKFFSYDSIEKSAYQKGVNLIREAIYARYIESISNCFLFVGVGGEDAAAYSKEKFKELFGKEENAIMQLLDEHGTYPSWYESDKEEKFREQAKKKLEEVEVGKK